MAQKSMVESVKEQIVSAIKGTGDIVNAVVDTVTGTVANTIKGTGAVATSLIGALSDTARASIQGAAQVGGDIGAAAKGAITERCGALRKRARKH
jgi:phage-related protein